MTLNEPPVQAYQEIEQRLVSETVFSQYMYKTLPSCNHLWAFKKQFCCQMALSGGEYKHTAHTLLFPMAQVNLLSQLCAHPEHHHALKSSSSLSKSY